jgi:hypothetical protein
MKNVISLRVRILESNLFLAREYLNNRVQNVTTAHLVQTNTFSLFLCNVLMLDNLGNKVPQFISC